jgi:hypothetical protein
MPYRALGVLAAVLLTTVAAADFVFFMLSGDDGLGVLLEGDVNTQNNAQLLTLRHKKYGEVILPRDQSKWYKAADPKKKLIGDLKAALKKEDVSELWRLAKDSIRRGSAGNYFKAAEYIAELDPNHKEAERARRLAALIDVEIPESKEEEARIRKKAKVDQKMEFERSEHFLLMHNLPPQKRASVTKVPRTQERLHVMESVYKAYLAFFWSRGFELAPPKERLHVVLLEKEQEFKEVAASQDADLVSSSGFFHLIDNVSYFYEHRGTPEYREMKSITGELEKFKKARNIANRGDIVRLGRALNLMIEVYSEQADVTVCSHEMTHQLSANTGLMPPKAPLPLWVAEGFACYFESPRDAQWSGIGSVNRERLSFYRKARRSNHSMCNLESVVSDRIFLEAKTHEEKLNAYSISWALTHFLMEKHFDRLMAYYQRLAKLPTSKYRMQPEESSKHFFACFTAAQKSTLDAQWHAYMTSLKTDLEAVTDEKLLEID